MNEDPIVIERTYNVSMAAVWQAITNRDEMKKWYFDLKEFKPEVGFEFRFTGGPPEKQYLHVCRITEVIPGNKLTHSWRYDGYEGISHVTFALSAEGVNTRLKLIHAGIDTFPKDNPHFAKKNFVEGWTDIIGRSLRKYLEKK